MAGNYPDVPAPRMAYDRDGTIGWGCYTDAASPTIMSGAQVATLNDEDGDGVATQTLVGTTGNKALFYGFIFPQLRSVSGYKVIISNTTTISTLEWSGNTTNGLDGTWNSLGNWAGTTAIGDYRNITAVALTGVSGLRWRLTNLNVNPVYQAIHLYGAIEAGQTPDRLRMWHPTLDEPLDDNTSADGAYFDWGDVQRNTTSDKTFRIKNNSATLTANSIVISQETPSDTTPTVNSQFTFSDGGAFAASIDIGNLAPGAISPVLTKRFTRPSNAALALWTSRTIANPTSWT